MTRSKVERERLLLEGQIETQNRRIASLEEALRDAHRASFTTADAEAQMLFIQHGWPADRENLRVWAYEFSEKVIEIAHPKPEDNDPRAHLYDGKRAFCPLCGRSPSPMFRGDYSGFAFPEGLRMHLRGRAPAKECRIMVNAVRLARERLGMSNWWE